MDVTVSWTPASLASARDRIAVCITGESLQPAAPLGPLVMRPHQRRGVTRLMEILARFRGALLADAVGLGKTYVALAVAREHRSAIVVCPAVLRPMWQRAMQRSEERRVGKECRSRWSPH